MAKKAKAKIKAKSSSRKSSSKKTAAKKNLKKKATIRKKKAAKKTIKKKTAKKKIGNKKTSATSPRIPKKTFEIEPGPPPPNIPPVEEPATNEEAIGTVTHFYSHLSVAIVQVNKSVLKTGSRIHFKGHTTDFMQQIESMEYEHQHVEEASAGQSIGLKVTDPVREHDIVYLVK